MSMAKRSLMMKTFVNTLAKSNFLQSFIIGHTIAMRNW